MTACSDSRLERTPADQSLLHGGKRVLLMSALHAEAASGPDRDCARAGHVHVRLFGAAVIDVGALVNTRRDAQSDVDRAALAGASACHARGREQRPGHLAALSRATDWAVRNGIDTSAPGFSVQVVSTCYSANDGVPDGVTVSVNRPAPSFFVLFNWSASATATACAGHSSGVTGFLPWALSLTAAASGTTARGTRAEVGRALRHRRRLELQRIVGRAGCRDRWSVRGRESVVIRGAREHRERRDGVLPDR